MSGKILVAYASRTGFTIGVAEKIASVLQEKGHQVVVAPVQEIQETAPYSSVVIGSAIQGSAWLPEAIQFLQKHKTDLASKPVAAFQVCMTLAMRDGDKYQNYVSSFMNAARAIIKPVSEASFAGGLDISKVPSLADRIKFKFSVILGVWKEDDHRDWKAIQSWASELNQLLQ